MALDPHNPLGMISDPYAGDTFVLPEALCTDQRRLWFRRSNEIIGFLMTTEFALKECKSKYEQLVSAEKLRPDTPLRIKSSDGRSIILPTQTFLKQSGNGVDVLCRQVFVMLYGSLETFLFELLERSFPEIGVTEKNRNRGTLMKTITLHPLVIVVEGFYASASEIRRTWDTSPCGGTGNGRLPDIP